MERMRSEFTITLRRSGTVGPVALWSGFEGRRVRGVLRGESLVRATARGRRGNSERRGDKESSNDPV